MIKKCPPHRNITYTETWKHGNIRPLILNAKCADCGKTIPKAAEVLQEVYNKRYSAAPDIPFEICRTK